MKAVLFWDTVPFSPYVKLCFEGKHCLHLLGRNLAEQGTRVQQVPSSEKSVQRRTTLRYIPEEGRIENIIF
jgi:hypothetical protein